MEYHKLCINEGLNVLDNLKVETGRELNDGAIMWTITTRIVDLPDLQTTASCMDDCQSLRHVAAMRVDACIEPSRLLHIPKKLNDGLLKAESVLAQDDTRLRPQDVIFKQGTGALEYIESLGREEDE